MTTMITTRSGPAEGVAFGEKLGLYEVMANEGPVTSKELARISGVPERHLLPWLRVQVAYDVVVTARDRGRYQTWCDIPRA